MRGPVFLGPYLKDPVLLARYQVPLIFWKLPCGFSGLFCFRPFHLLQFSVHSGGALGLNFVVYPAAYLEAHRA